MNFGVQPMARRPSVVTANTLSPPVMSLGLRASLAKPWATSRMNDGSSPAVW